MFRSISRAILTALVFSLIAVPLMAGGAQEDDEPDVVEIRFPWWGDSSRHEVYNEIADRFEEANPDIRVAREPTSWPDYWDRLTTQVAGGNAPDVVSMHQFYVASYARRGALRDMWPLVESGHLNLDGIPDSVIGSGELAGELLMTAKGVTMTGWSYNTAVFDELGLDYPDFDWTRDDFVETATAVAEGFREHGYGDGYFGASDGSGDLTPFQYWVRQEGGELFTEEGQLGFDREMMIGFFEFWEQLREDGVIPDAETIAEQEGLPPEQSLYAQGRVGIHQHPFNQITHFEPHLDGGEAHLLRHPTLPGGEIGEFIEGAYLAISSDSEHPEAAARFISFFTNTEEAAEIFMTEQGPPPATRMQELVAGLVGPMEARELEGIQRTLAIADGGSPAPFDPPERPEIQAAFEDAGEAIRFGQLSVEAAVDRFFDEAEMILQ